MIIQTQDAEDTLQYFDNARRVKFHRPVEIDVNGVAHSWMQDGITVINYAYDEDNISAVRMVSWYDPVEDKGMMLLSKQATYILNDEGQTLTRV